VKIALGRPVIAAPDRAPLAIDTGIVIARFAQEALDRHDAEVRQRHYLL
jgi:hypothetical protein